LDSGASVTEVILAAVISGGVVSVLLGFVLRVLFDRRLGRATEEIKNEFAERALVYRSNREWREASITELLGPVYMQLDRSGRAFERWRSRNIYIETAIMKEGNTTVRDLLLAKGSLIPPELLEHAGKLVEHYDRWLEEYENVRGGEHPDPNAPFVFVGPKGFPFPRDFRAGVPLDFSPDVGGPVRAATGMRET
jgi:hypothetical protein